MQTAIFSTFCGYVIIISRAKFKRNRRAKYNLIRIHLNANERDFVISHLSEFIQINFIWCNEFLSIQYARGKVTFLLLFVNLARIDKSNEKQ